VTAPEARTLDPGESLLVEADAPAAGSRVDGFAEVALTIEGEELVAVLAAGPVILPP
jgi:TusA-related sulfurtransferase